MHLLSIFCFSHCVHTWSILYAIGEDNAEKKAYLQRKISEYMTRAETLKSHIKDQQRKGEIIDKIHIIANGTNYSYETIFGKYLNDAVKEISLEEPYLREYYQVFDQETPF